MKKPTKAQLLSTLKKYNFEAAATAKHFGVDEKSIRRWCEKHGIDREFERKKAILEYEHIDVTLNVSKKASSTSTAGRGKGSEETRRVFVFSDMQIPYHDDGAVALAINRCRDYLNDSNFKGQSYVIIIGDYMDYQPLLGKEKMRQPVLTTDELKALDLEFLEASKILTRIEAVLPNNCIKVFLKGNHEDRADKIIEKSGGDYWKRHIDIDERLGLTNNGWTVLDYNEYYKIGHLHYTHGSFYNTSHAQKHAQVYGKCIIYGHTHQVQTFTLPSPARSLSVWAASVGCLAKVNPEWQRNKPNAHDHAFAEISYLGDDFFPSIHRIIKGRVVINGKVYTA